MPSFDIVSEVDLAESKNAVDQARRELRGRFDFKNTNWEIEETKNAIVLNADDEFKLKALSEILMGKLAKRSISLKNIETGKIEVSSVGRARQELTLKQGFEGPVSKELCKSIRGLGIKVQAQPEGGKIRVTGKKRDDLQKVMQFLRGEELEVGITFENLRD